MDWWRDGEEQLLGLVAEAGGVGGGFGGVGKENSSPTTSFSPNDFLQVRKGV